MNNPQYFYVGNGWSSPNYATASACWTAQASIASGDIVMLCKGHVGNSQNLSGAHTHSLYIFSDGITYKGHNESELATVNNLNISVTSPVYLNDILPITTNRYIAAFTLATDSLIAKRIVFDNKTSGGVAFSILGYFPNSRIERFIARGGIDVVRAGYHRGTNLLKGIVHSGVDKGIKASSGVDEFLVVDVLSFRNGGNDFDNGAISQTRCASEDNTGTDTGYSSTDLKDFANKDYRIKESSPLHALGIGAFFEEQSSAENYSATLAFSNSHSVDLQAIKTAANSIAINSLSSTFVIGQKANKTALHASTNNIVKATGFKTGRSKLLSNNAASISINGVKHSSNTLHLSNETSFTISGIADNIIRKSAILSINNNSTFSLSGSKSSKGKISLSQNSFSEIIGFKSISNFINTDNSNSTILACVATRFGQLHSNHSNLVELFPFSGFSIPLVRSITIEGKFYLLQIPCNLDNTLTIEGNL